MRFLFHFLFSLLFLLLCNRLSSQGCSDAGVCSVGSLGIVQFNYEKLPLIENKLKLLVALDPDDLSGNNEMATDSLPKTGSTSNSNPDTIPTKKKVKMFYSYQFPKYIFQYTASYGVGDRGTALIVNQLEANFKLGKKKIFAQVKLPHTFINGNLGQVNGVGDVTLSMTYIFDKKIRNLSLTVGVKIPTNDANIQKDNLPLPMVYQTSLGSTDLLIGAKYSYKKWDISAGYQHSFNSNKNGYLHLSGIADSTNYNGYFESNMLRRADDGIFRINRNFFSKKINVSTSVLFIYHMADDSYTNKEGNRDKIKNSQGLTLNLNLAGMIPVSKKMDVVFIFASPVVIREARPDGLTRKFVAILGLKLNVF